jgi:cellulose synthase/poly-beta-1,6-N-acetylglucosamine synthase-like glycosyltransferase
MKFIFWFFLFLILYCYLGYPLILIIFRFIFGKKTKKEEIIPSVSLLIPVYNEEKVIQKKIENSLRLDYPKDKLEIVVASESDDKTNEIVKKYESRGVKLFVFSGREGKQYTIYRTLPKCQGEIVVLTDANGMFKNDALKKLARNFADSRIGCVSGELKYVNPQKTSIGENESLYWKYEVFIKKLESKIQSVLGANGSIYALRKELYSPVSKYRGDDFELSVRIAQQGYGVILDEEAISIEETHSDGGKEFKRRISTIAWDFQGAFLLLKDSLKKIQPILVFQLISHKILRWLIGFFLIFIFLSNIFLISKPFYLILFICQVGFYSLAIFGYLIDKRGKKLNKVVNLAYYFCLINLAALVGVIKGILGKQKPIWEKVR